MRNLAFVSLLLIVVLSFSTLFAQTEPVPLPTAQSGLSANNASNTPYVEVAPLTLIDPVNVATNVTQLPVFSWTVLPEATDYILIVKHKAKTKLKTSFDATAICADQICTVDLSTLPDTQPLKMDRTYKWRIKAITPDESIKTDWQKFTVATSALQPRASAAVTNCGFLGCPTDGPRNTLTPTFTLTSTFTPTFTPTPAPCYDPITPVVYSYFSDPQGQWDSGSYIHMVSTSPTFQYDYWVRRNDFQEALLVDDTQYIQRIDIRTFKTDTTNYPDSLKITIGDYIGTRNYPYGWAFDYHFPAGPTNSSHPNITPPVKTDKIIFERNGGGGDRIDISWVRVYYCSSVPPTATPTRTMTPTKTLTPTITLTPGSISIVCNSTISTSAPPNGANIRALPDENSQLLGSLAAGQEFRVYGKNPEGTWFKGEGESLHNGSTVVGWVRGDLLSFTGCDPTTFPIIDGSGNVMTPTPTPLNPTATPTPTTTPTADPNAPSPISVKVEFVGNNVVVNGVPRLIPYRTELTIRITLKNISDELGQPVTIQRASPNGNLSADSFISFGAPLDSNGNIQPQNYEFIETSNGSGTQRLTWSMGDWIGQSPWVPGLGTASERVKEVKIRATRSGLIKFNLLMTGRMYNDTNHPGGIYYPYFSRTDNKTRTFPVTYMQFGSGQPLEKIRSAIFWVTWIESSEGNFQTRIPDDVPCDETPPAGQTWGANGLITKIEHCRAFQYMHAQTIINGLLNTERKPGVLAGQATYPEFRPFRYFSNYGSSIWTGTYTIWNILYNDYEAGPEGACPNLGWSSTSYGPYADVLDPAKSSGDWEPVIDWLHEYLQCAVQVRRARLPGEYGYDYGKAFVAFYDATMPIIDLAINDFMNNPNADPSDGAYGILAANANGATAGYATLISGIPNGTPYDVNDSNQSAHIGITYPTHIANLKTTYGPAKFSVSKPVIWAQRNLDSQGNYPWGPYFWLSITYQTGDDQYHFPRQ